MLVVIQENGRVEEVQSMELLLLRLLRLLTLLPVHIAVDVVLQ